MTDRKTQSRDIAIAISALVFSWNNGHNPILNIERLNVKRGERVFIEGPSGSGKSTLLSLIAGVTIPQKGAVTVNGVQINTLGGAARDRFRADHVGFIYQMFNLIPYLTVVENVTLPCRFSQRRQASAADRAGSVHSEVMRLLDRLGMADPVLIQTPVTDLSVGQQQRVAAARALIGSPDILIADEPTSSLDETSAAVIEELLQQLKTSHTILMVSHYRSQVKRIADLKLELANGRFQQIKLGP